MSEVADFSQLVDYTPYEGDGVTVLLPFDGDIKVKVVKIKKGTSKNSGNQTLKIVMHVDEEGQAGTLYKDIPYTGTRTDGKSNMVGLADFLLSCGWTFDQIKQFASKGQQVQIDSLIQQIEKGDKIAFVSVEADMYKNRESSKVTNFITPKRYAEQVRNGQARRPRAGAPVSNGTGANTASSGGADPLAGLM